MFNMKDPLVGGLDPPKVALRRAISMSFDDAEWMRVFDQGLGYAQQHLIGPDIVGYDPPTAIPTASTRPRRTRCSTASATSAAPTACGRFPTARR
jgi:hypothetical protein